MLLKVSDGNGGWILIDNVDHVHLLSKKYNIVTQSELKGIEGEDTLNFISKECFGKDPINVCMVEYTKNSKVNKALFTNIVYVCDNNGDTLDKFKTS